MAAPQAGAAIERAAAVEMPLELYRADARECSRRDFAAGGSRQALDTRRIDSAATARSAGGRCDSERDGGAQPAPGGGWFRRATVIFRRVRFVAAFEYPQRSRCGGAASGVGA